MASPERGGGGGFIYPHIITIHVMYIVHLYNMAKNQEFRSFYKMCYLGQMKVSCVLNSEVSL